MLHYGFTYYCGAILVGEGKVVESEKRKEKAKAKYTEFLESCRVMGGIKMTTGLELQRRREILFYSLS